MPTFQLARESALPSERCHRNSFPNTQQVVEHLLCATFLKTGEGDPMSFKNHARNVCDCGKCSGGKHRTLEVSHRESSKSHWGGGRKMLP